MNNKIKVAFHVRGVVEFDEFEAPNSSVNVNYEGSSPVGRVRLFYEDRVEDHIYGHVYKITRIHPVNNK